MCNKCCVFVALVATNFCAMLYKENIMKILGIIIV